MQRLQERERLEKQKAENWRPVVGEMVFLPSLKGEAHVGHSAPCSLCTLLGLNVVFSVRYCEDEGLSGEVMYSRTVWGGQVSTVGPCAPQVVAVKPKKCQVTVKAGLLSLSVKFDEVRRL